MLHASKENTWHVAPGDGEKVNVSIWGLGHAGIGATPGSHYPMPPSTQIFFTPGN